MRRLLLELKIAGINFLLVTAALSLALVLFAALAGELLDFAPIAFEVVFPLYAAIAVGEWGRSRSDLAFEAIAAQSPARFPWMLCRFFAVFAAVSLFALATMLAAACVRPGLALGEMVLLCLPTGFFFASVAALVGSLSPPKSTWPPWCAACCGWRRCSPAACCACPGWSMSIPSCALPGTSTASGCGIKRRLRGQVQKSPPQPHLHAVLAPPCQSFSPTFTH